MEVWLEMRTDRKIGATLYKGLEGRWVSSDFGGVNCTCQPDQIDILDSSLVGCFVRRD